MLRILIIVLIFHVFNISVCLSQMLYVRGGIAGNVVDLTGFKPIVDNYNNTSTFRFVEEKHKMKNFGYLDGFNFSLGGGYKNIYFDAGFCLAAQTQKSCHDVLNMKYITRDLKIVNDYFNFTIGAGLGNHNISCGLGITTQIGNLRTTTRTYENESKKGNWEVLDSKLTSRMGPSFMIAFGNDYLYGKFMLNISYTFGLGEYNTSNLDRTLNGIIHNSPYPNDLKVINNSFTFGLTAAFYILNDDFGNIVYDIKKRIITNDSIKNRKIFEVWDWNDAILKNVTSDYYDFIKKYPNSIHSEEAKDKLKKCYEFEETTAWKEALMKNNLDSTYYSMQKFLNKFSNKPYSKYSDSARIFIKEFEEKKSKEKFYRAYEFFISTYKFYIDDDKITKDTSSIIKLIKEVTILSEYPYERANLDSLRLLLLWKLDLANAFNASLYYLENHPYDKIKVDKLIEILGKFILYKDKFSNEKSYLEVSDLYNLLLNYCSKYERFYTYANIYLEEGTNHLKKFSSGYPFLEKKIIEIERTKKLTNLPAINTEDCKY
jgi:hypothetical protein